MLIICISMRKSSFLYKKSEKEKLIEIEDITGAAKSSE